MGQRRKIKARPSDTKIQVAVRESGNSGYSMSSSDTPRKFRFALEDTTELAAKSKVGDEVFGDFGADRVMIMGRASGVLGFAPRAVSRAMVKLATAKGTSITGTIVGVGGETTVEVVI